MQSGHFYACILAKTTLRGNYFSFLLYLKETSNKSNSMKHRIETDSIGEIQVPADKYWGAQTQRSIENFPIGPSGSMPLEVIRAYGIIKKAAASTNNELGILNDEKAALISRVCDEIIAGDLDDHFPLVVWQTGSGTHTNMNVNEVISNRAKVLAGDTADRKVSPIHPNDDANKSQSSNDTFSTAMHIAACRQLLDHSFPALEKLRNSLHKKAEEMSDIVKIGRTHFMDATPITLGQEFSGYVSQVEHGIAALKNTIPHLLELTIGGTAVGTGLNAPPDYSEKVVAEIARLCDIPFFPAHNKFEAQAAHDAFVESHGALKQLAVSLLKIANDIRLMASGPASGIGELILPANEPGSSIMPGKVNPTQVEAMNMVCVQIMGNDSTISIAGSNGIFELNTYKPLIIHSFLQSAGLLADVCHSFSDKCVAGIQPNRQKISFHVEHSLMLATALNPHIGYEKAAKIAYKAYHESMTLKEAALALNFVTEKEFDEWVKPEEMIGRNGNKDSQ